MSKENLKFGLRGEEQAVALLRKDGYRIIARNYKSKLGEIDIIAYDRNTLCFIEVKTRQSDKFGIPQEAISTSKQKHIARAALLYLKENNLLGKKPARFDVVSVLDSKGGPRIDLIKSAFELDHRFIY